MLVLSRKVDEAIVIDGVIRVTVVGLRGNHVRLGIEAPEHVTIYREELCSPTAGEKAAKLSFDPMERGVTVERTAMRVRRLEPRFGDQASAGSRGERTRTREQS